jgi:ribosomal protein S18 acetylase RimI-like enzyme
LSDNVLIFLVRNSSDRPEAPQGLVFRWAEPSDGDRYARDVGTDSPTTFRNRLDASTHCYLVESDDRIVHATWVTTSGAWMRELQRYFLCPDGDAYIFESYTRPEVRGRGIYPLAIRSLAHALGAQGIARMWVGIEGHNPASLRAVTKAGFAEAFEIPYRRRLARLTVGEPSGPKAELGRGRIVRARRFHIPRRGPSCIPGGAGKLSKR